MNGTTNGLFVSCAIFCAVFMLPTAHAERAAMPAAAPDLRAIQLPDYDRVAMLDAVKKLRSELIQRKRELVQNVADGRLDGKDALITAILPGGLLYASYKKARYEQARDELARVSTDIEELSGDLLAMQAGPVTVAVAQLPVPDTAVPE